MDEFELNKKFFQAARQLPEETHVPYAFEKRVMAQIASLSQVDPWVVVGQWLWKATGPYVGIMIAASLWAFATARSEASEEFIARGLERNVMAPFQQLENSW